MKDDVAMRSMEITGEGEDAFVGRDEPISARIVLGKDDDRLVERRFGGQDSGGRA